MGEPDFNLLEFPVGGEVLRPLELVGEVRCVLKGFRLVVSPATNPKVGKDDDFDLGLAVDAVTIFIAIILRPDGFRSNVIDASVRLDCVRLDDPNFFVSTVVRDFLLSENGNPLVILHFVDHFDTLSDGPVFEDVYCRDGFFCRYRW